MKRSLFTAIILFVSLPAMAEIFVTERGESGIDLTAPTCKQLKANLIALQSWKKSSDNITCKIPKMKKKNTWPKGCRAPIENCLPKRVRKHHGTNPETDGPNCWNLSLVYAGILPELRVSPPDEMTFYMDSPLCRLLDEGEERRAGDIGAIRRDGSIEVHGFIYVSSELAYSKNGAFYANPFALQPLSEVYDTYGLKKAKKECLGNRIPFDCEVGVDLYRCISMDEYLGMQDEAVEVLDEIDSVTSKLAFSNSTLNYSTLQTTRELISKFSTEVQMNNHEPFMLQAANHRLDGIYLQLDTYADSEKYEQDQYQDLLTDLMVLIRNAQKNLEELVTGR